MITKISKIRPVLMLLNIVASTVVDQYINLLFPLNASDPLSILNLSLLALHISGTPASVV